MKIKTCLKSYIEYFFFQKFKLFKDNLSENVYVTDCNIYVNPGQTRSINWSNTGHSDEFTVTR